MHPGNRNLVTIDDLPNGEIEALFSLADEMADSINAYAGLCQGKIMASLFFEPSTRTRLSFEAAMLRLGGHVISAVDIGASSLAKGESIADMAKVVGGYADVVVIRHPWEGAARVVADYAGVPVINAGDGGHEHPTQTLCDLYTIRKERQTLKGLRIALWGDLKHGRTVHSLIYALARFGATILFYPGPGLELPEHVIRRLSTEYRGELKRSEDLDQGAKRKFVPIDAVYVTPSSPHQLAMMPDISIQVELKAGVDALYVTRLQKERQAPAAEQRELGKDYPVVDRRLLRGKEFEKTLVMHPLPRVDELACEVDSDPRSMYFKQAAYGVPVRMALLSFLLGAREIPTQEAGDSFVKKTSYPVYKRDSGVRCPNKNCVSNQETEVKYIKPQFKTVSLDPVILRCIYCDHEVSPRYVASSDWHQGKRENKKYHSAGSHWARKIKPENLIVFTSEKEAQARQFKPSRYVRR
ncbi:MAG: aspartate carbamoyltransferase catalytic subunit [Dehalococcoidia bacterium]